MGTSSLVCENKFEDADRNIIWMRKNIFLKDFDTDNADIYDFVMMLTHPVTS